MSSGLLAYIDENIESKDKYFYHRGKYRTVSWSFAKVYDYAKRFASLLHQFKVKKGDKVIIKGQNRPEWVVAYLGCLLQGAVVVPLDINSSTDFEKKVQEKIKAKVKVHPSSEKKFPGLISIIIEDIEERLSSIPPLESPDMSVSSDDLAQIVFTSGTTAVPKGVMITYSNIESNLKSVKLVMERWRKFFRLMWNLKILSVVPLSHMYGQLIGIYIPMMICGSVVFMSSISPRDIVKAVKEERIWILGTLPKVLELLRDYIVKNLDLGNRKFERKYNIFKKIKWPLRFLAFLNIHLKIGWRLVAMIVGGAAFDRNIDEFWRCIAYTIFQGYGLTETAPLITLADPAQTGAGSIGKVLDGQKIRLVDSEIYVRGNNVSPGYYENPQLTEEAFSKGWFKTGDLAEIGEDGNLYFKGRKDTVVVRADGINIYPEDIESVLKANSLVKDCVVLGLGYGSNLEIHAVLMLEDKYSGSPENIIKEANRKLNVYQHINSCSIWDGDDFPRTSTEKIKRDEVAKAVSSGRTKKKARGPKPYRKSQEILEVIKNFHKIKSKSIRKEARLEKDLGLDSLDLVQLAGAIEEKYDIEVDDSQIFAGTTVGDLETLIKSSRKASQKIPFYSLPFRAPVRFIRVIFQYILYPFMSVIYRLKVEGRENLKNLKGPVVFAANHTSHLDTFVVLYSLPLKLRKRVATLMSIEHHFNHFFYQSGPWWRRAVEAMGFYLLVNLFINVFPLSRTHGFKQIMENIGRMLSRGWSMLIYPEGGVTTDGGIKEFEPGVGVIASDMEASVVPVRIKGLFNILRNGILPWKHMPRWPLVTVSFGKLERFKDKDYRKIAGIIEKAVRSL